MKYRVDFEVFSWAFRSFLESGPCAKTVETPAKNKKDIRSIFLNFTGNFDYCINSQT